MIETSSVEATTTETDIKKLTDKGHPDTMTAWFLGKVTALREHISAAQKGYASEVAKALKNKEDMSLTQASTKVVDDATELLEAQQTDFKNKKFADVKNLVS